VPPLKHADGLRPKTALRVCFNDESAVGTADRYVDEACSPERNFESSNGLERFHSAVCESDHFPGQMKDHSVCQNVESIQHCFWPGHCISQFAQGKPEIVDAHKQAASGHEGTFHFCQDLRNIRVRYSHRRDYSLKTGVRKWQRFCPAAKKWSCRISLPGGAERLEIQVNSDHPVVDAKLGSYWRVAGPATEIENAHTLLSCFRDYPAPKNFRLNP
jgi:hypothetical protein